MEETRDLKTVTVEEVGTLSPNEAAQFLCCDPPTSSTPLTRLDLEEN